MNSVFIYSLHDPETGHMRYIGKAKDPAYRLKDHVRRISKEKNHRAYWIRSLSARGLEPLQFIIEEVPETEWQTHEMFYIQQARLLGFDLVNSTDGGEGRNNPTPELRAKISAAMTGKKKTPEHCANISAALTGRKFSEEHRGNLKEALTGRKSPHSGHVCSPQHRANISAAVRGEKHPNWGKKFSEATREKMRLAWVRRKVHML